MKTRVTKRLKDEMGLEIKPNGQLVDKYGRVFETFVDKSGYEDIRPIGTYRR